MENQKTLESDFLESGKGAFAWGADTASSVVVRQPSRPAKDIFFEQAQRLELDESSWVVMLVHLFNLLAGQTARREGLQRLPFEHPGSGQ